MCPISNELDAYYVNFLFIFDVVYYILYRVIPLVWVLVCFILYFGG